MIQTALFTRDYNYRVVHVLTATKYRSYLLKLIYVCGHFVTVNNRRYGRCYVKAFTPPCTFLAFYTQLETNSARSFQNAFTCVQGFPKTKFLMKVDIFQPVGPP